MPTSETIPLTALGAVNVMLRAIGRVPVSSLEGDVGGTDRDDALQELTDTSREVQEEGWRFNEELKLPLQPNAEGEIVLPTNALKTKTVHSSFTKDLVQRGTKLYDREEHTFNIGETVYVDIVVALDFEDLPTAARWYVTVKASRRFGTQRFPDLDQFRFSSLDENDARNRMELADGETDNRSLKTANDHIWKMRRR